MGPRIPNGGGILRPVLHRIFSEATRASGATVRLGVSVAAIEQGAAGVAVDFTDGTSRTYDLIVGADGIHSRLRAMIFPDAPPPVFTGQGCWRAVVPRPAAIDCGHVYVGGPVKAGITPVSQDEMYLFLLQHVPGNPRMPEEDWPELLAEQLRGFGGALGAVRDSLDAIRADQLPAAGETAAAAALAPRPRRADRRCRACDHAASGLGRGARGRGCAGAGRIAFAPRSRWRMRCGVSWRVATSAAAWWSRIRCGLASWRCGARRRRNRPSCSARR